MSTYAMWIQQHPYSTTSRAVVRSRRLDETFFVAVSVRRAQYWMFGHASGILRTLPRTSVLLKCGWMYMSDACLCRRGCCVRHASLGITC